ncbi:MAG TPA: hypothetical protein VNJ08_09700 [Bacteriovoracaceae bacterium]|nr:hypothetical protein [Bacteriovoracaceae bacterium]
MKFATFLIGALMLHPQVTVAGPEDFPICMTDKDSGSLLPSFFDDFSKVSMKLGVCDTTMDPRMKAFLYVQNLRDFTKHLPNKISDEVSDAANAKQDEMVSALDTKQKVKIPRNSESMIMKGTFIGMGLVPGGKYLAELSNASMDGAFNKKLETVQPGPLVFSTLEDQQKQVIKIRDQLNSSFEVMHDKLTRVLDAINNPQGNTAKNLTIEEKDYLRSVICRFMPAAPRDLKRDRNDYLTFCSNEHGGGNFNQARGSLFCSDVETISQKNRDREYQNIKSALSRSIAENVVLPDPYKLKENGTTSRIEIKVTDFRGNGQKKNIAMGYRSSGGIQQLCSILKGPDYNRYWRYKEGRRTLSPIMPLVSLKLPLSIDWKTGNPKHPDSETFNVNKDGDIDSVKINESKAIKPDHAYDKHFSEKKTEAKFLPVRNLVGDKCDE